MSDQLPAGEDLDRLVQAQVLGRREGGLAYSTDLGAAWRVIEHLMRQGYRYVIHGNSQGDGQHWVRFERQNWSESHPVAQGGPCASLPLAICQAALEVMAARKERA